MEEKYDLIFCGGGLSTLVFLDKIVSDSYFDKQKILVIEKDQKIPKKTWSFWEPKESKWNDFTIKSWDKIIFKSKSLNLEKELSNINYKMIKSESFYNHIINRIKPFSNIDFYKDDVVSVKDLNDHVVVTTNKNEFKCVKVLNSVLNDSYRSNKKFPVLLQHFVGWTIQTKENVFDADIDNLTFSSDDKNIYFAQVDSILIPDINEEFSKLSLINEIKNAFGNEIIKTKNISFNDELINGLLSQYK